MIVQDLMSLREGMSYMMSSSTSSTMVRRPRAPVFWLRACAAVSSSASGGEDQVDFVQLKELAVLLDDRVLGLRQNANQGVAIQRLETHEDGETSDELGNQAVLEQILGNDGAL